MPIVAFIVFVVVVVIWLAVLLTVVSQGLGPGAHLWIQFLIDPSRLQRSVNIAQHADHEIQTQAEHKEWRKRKTDQCNRDHR